MTGHPWEGRSMKKWMLYHNQIPLAEGEIPMDKGGFRNVPMTQADVDEIMEVLDVCANGNPSDKCDNCPFDWMEDHGLSCVQQMAEGVLALFDWQKQQRKLKKRRVN